MNAALFRLIEDKLIPLALVGLAGLFYWLNLPEMFCGGVAGAGLLAFQVAKTNPPQS